MMPIRGRALQAGVVALLCQAQSAHACAVCFGEGNGNWSGAFYSGTLIMLALPPLIIGGFGVALYRAAKRVRELESASPGAAQMDRQRPAPGGLPLRPAPLG